MIKNIKDVVENELCTGCGTCAALCPKEAIQLTINEKKGIYVPKIDEEKCNNCGICYEVCPGHSVDFKQLNLEIFGKEPENILIGNYINCYVGHATDYDIRYNSASGGLITALLIFALEEGIIDGALVTRMKKDRPLEPEPFIARTREEIIEASKSKYCPVPANIALKEVLNSKKEEKFAVVGLPCHIQGIRKVEQINKKLREKIIFHFGIVCNHTPTFLATEFLLKKINVKKEDIKKIDYRGRGWPGGMLVTFRNNDKQFIPLSYFFYWGNMFSSYFFPIRCTLCSDQTCELSDISFADAWLPEFNNDKIGRSIIVSRTEVGEKILMSMNSKGYIESNKIERDKVIQSQESVLYLRKKNLSAHISFLSFFGKDIPKSNSALLKQDIIDYFITMLRYMCVCVSSNRCSIILLGYIPKLVLKLSSMFISLLVKIQVSRLARHYKSKYH